MDTAPRSRSVCTRRSALAATAMGISVAASGCTNRLTRSINPISDDSLSLSITTLPADADREGVQVARQLREHLKEVGISASVDMRPRSEYLRQILLRQDFDLFVGHLVDVDDPDVLYEALHSRFAAESGWQNPFGVTNRTLDRLLEEQRQTEGEERQAAVATLATAVADELPFVPVCRPEEYRLARSDTVTGWSGRLTDRRDMLALEAQTDDAELAALLTDSGPSRNINPLAAPYRDRDTITSLLYDSLATVDGEPWLAHEWEWTDDRVLLVRLREDCHFHDGESLTAADVAFTYRLLADTSLGHAVVASPSPRYRRHASTVERADAIDEVTVRLEVDASRPVALQALTVPILPAHIWEESITERVRDGDEFTQGTHAIVDDGDLEPIGSGPYAYVDSSDREYLELERYDDHFTMWESELPSASMEGIVFGIDPSSLSMIDQIEAGVADVTISPLDANAVSRAQEVDDEDVETIGVTSTSVLIVGFNTRSVPLSDPAIRHAVAGLVDKAWTVTEIYEGYGEPVATPLTDEWVPSALEWDEEDPVTPFVGENGELDVDEAKLAFQRARLPYDDGFLDPGA